MTAHLLPPHSDESERAVLGGLFLAPHAADDVFAILSPDDFYHPGRRDAMRAIAALATAREPVDPLTVHAWMLAHGVEIARHPEAFAALMDLLDNTPSAANIEHYATIVREHAVARRVAALATAITGEAMAGGVGATDAWYDSIERRVYDLTERREERPLVALDDALHAAVRQMDDRSAHKGELLGAQTGFGPFDEATNGLQGSRLYVLASRPGIGKTSVAIQIASSVATGSGGRPALIFSLEMAEREITNRFLTQRAGVDGRKLTAGTLSPEDLEAVSQAAAEAYHLPIYIDDSAPLSVAEIRRKTRKAALLRGLPPGLIVIDYLQLMAPRAREESREREVADLSRSLKALAKELDCPVLVLSQLNRQSEMRPDKKPELGDLRESGAVEQDADVVWFLWHKPGAPRNRIESYVAKNRHGPTKGFALAFDRPSTRFTAWEGGGDEEEEESQSQPRLDYKMRAAGDTWR